jgi:hypothetical protein
MEPSKVKTSTAFHEEYYQLDIATGYFFQKMALVKKAEERVGFGIIFVCLLEN